MSNPPKVKGTGFENHLIEAYLRRIWPSVSRAPLRGIRDFGDFVGVGDWFIEAKKWDRWDLPKWIRDIQRKIARNGNGSHPWLLFFAGDKRKGLGDLVAMPAEQFTSIMEALQAARGDADQWYDEATRLLGQLADAKAPTTKGIEG